MIDFRECPGLKEKWDPLGQPVRQATKDSKVNREKKDPQVLKEELDNKDLQDLRVLKATRYGHDNSTATQFNTTTHR